MHTIDHSITLASGAVSLRANAASDVGSVRTLNEDSFLADTPVFLVADGMGGHSHGDWASHTVVETFASQIPSGGVTTPAAILSTISRANSAVRELPLEDSEAPSVAGSTLSGVALVTEDGRESIHWMVFNVGDSRVYSWDGALFQLTVDHSAVQELIDDGEITESEARRHPERNVITRAVGVSDDVEPDVWLLPAGGNQIFLLCSDGLTKDLDDQQISEIVAKAVAHGETSSLAATLVSAAVEAGGRDNITVVIVEASIDSVVSGDDAESASDTGSMPAFLEETLPRL